MMKNISFCLWNVNAHMLINDLETFQMYCSSSATKFHLLQNLKHLIYNQIFLNCRHEFSLHWFEIKCKSFKTLSFKIP